MLHIFQARLLGLDERVAETLNVQGALLTLFHNRPRETARLTHPLESDYDIRLSNPCMNTVPRLHIRIHQGLTDWRKFPRECLLEIGPLLRNLCVD